MPINEKTIDKTDIEEKFKVSHYKDDSGNTLNNLKEIMKSKEVTLAMLANELKVSQQQISKYVHGINLLDVEKMALASRYLTCWPSDIYPQLDINNKTKLLSATSREQKLKKQQSSIINNTYITNNNGVVSEMGKFFKNITTVDFLTLNKKVVVALLSLVCIAIITARVVLLINYNYSAPFVERAFLVVNLLDFYVMVTGLLIGLALPLMVQSFLSYIPLWLGFEASIYFASQYVYFGIHPVPQSVSERIIVSIVAFVLTLGYGFLIKKLKSKYLQS